MAGATLDTYGHPIASPTGIRAFATFDTSPSNPTPSSTSLPASSSEDEDRPNNGLFNYYFLLLALIIILLGILYLTYARRQRQRLALRRQNGQRALARDIERWGGGGPWGPGRFHHIPRNTSRSRNSGPRAAHPERRVEGLNESGEAPPPYIPKEPEPAYVGVGREMGNDIPLRDMGGDRKPPDYDEGPSSVRHDGGAAGTGPVMRGD